MTLEQTALRVTARILETPLANDLLTGARATARAVHDAVFTALDMPKATELEHLFGHIRSMGRRLATIEDAVDHLGRQLNSLSAQLAEIDRKIGESAERTPR